MRVRVILVLGFVAVLLFGGAASWAGPGTTHYWSIGPVGQSQTDNSLGHVGTTGVSAGVVGLSQSEYTGYQGQPHLRETTLWTPVGSAGQGTSDPDWMPPARRTTGVSVGALGPIATVSQTQNLDDGTCAFNVSIVAVNVISQPCPAGTELPEIPQVPYMPPPGMEHVCNPQGQCT